MNIGGIQKFSLLDYPGQLAAIVFTQGCNFRCPFCYNPKLVWPAREGKLAYQSFNEGKLKDHPIVSTDDFLSFLERRKGKLDAVVLTGGEPMIQRDLKDFIKKIKEMDFLVKLDTNGTDPGKLSELLSENLLDYIAMDLKNSWEKYLLAAGVGFELAKIKKSIKIIKESKVPYEFRTTVVPGYTDSDDIEKMGEAIKGARNWYLQNFKANAELLDKNLGETKPFTQGEMRQMQKLGNKYVEFCGIR